MKKRLFAILTAVFLLCSMLPLGAASVSAAKCGDLTYTISDGKITITDCSSSASGALTIPDTIDGYPVTAIGDYAFWYCTSLTSITIPGSITTIGEQAFYNCTKLTSVTIPDSVTKIGSRAFYGTAYYNNDINWENNVLYIGNHLIDAGYISGAYEIKPGTLTIGGQAFYECRSLTLVTIPDSVTTIGDWVFRDCTSLASVTIPDSVTTIGKKAFYHCDSLTSVAIPDSVTTIGEEAFYHCDSLALVTIGDSVTTIEYGAFEYCYSLISVTIPDSVTTIGENAFYWCDSLMSIDVDENNPNYCDVDGVLFNKSKTTLMQYLGGKSGAYTIPDSVTTIGDEAFEHCTKLTSVTIPDSVTKIGGRAFSNCYALTSVTIPDSVTSIGESAFSFCDSLTSVTIPDSVTSIGSGAFGYCDILTTVHYHGTKADKAAISIGSYNDNLTSATWHYYDDAHDAECNDCGEVREGILIYGDANGDGAVNARDIVLLQQFMAGWDVTLSSIAADVDGNGYVVARDLALLQQYVAGWNVELGK